MKNHENFDYLFNIKRVKIFLAIKDGMCIHQINKNVDVTYTHMTKVFNMLKECDLVRIEKKGRENKVTLTEKGKRLKNLFNKLDESF